MLGRELVLLGVAVHVEVQLLFNLITEVLTQTWTLLLPAVPRPHLVVLVHLLVLCRRATDLLSEVVLFFEAHHLLAVVVLLVVLVVLQTLFFLADELHKGPFVLVFGVSLVLFLLALRHHHH